MSSSSTKNAFVFLALSVALCGYSAGAFADEATVLWTDGEVQLQPAGSETLEPVTAGTAVPEGSRVVTSENVSCGLGFEGSLAESAVTLKPETSAQLKTLGDSTHIELEQGSLFVKLAKLKKDSQFVVATPTAIASARGTGWLQSMDQIEVFEGTVSIKNSSDVEETVPEGEAAQLGSDGSVSNRYSASDENRSSWETFNQRAASSPYFNRINAGDILRIRETIDAKRGTAACGSAGAYSWATVVAPGTVAASAQINELKTALTEPPFLQSDDFVKTYLDPVPTLHPGDPVRASTLDLILEAAKNASC
jgi:hypothetical protein